MMCVCGMTLGFRGCQEHADLDKRMIDRGNFEKGHPLEGKEFFAIKNMTRKTNKLSTRAVHVKTNKNARVPVDSYVGNIVETILRHLSPFQNCIYCQRLTVKQKARLPAGHMLFKVPRKAKPPLGGAKPPRGGRSPPGGGEAPPGGRSPLGGRSPPGMGGAKPRVDILKKKSQIFFEIPDFNRTPT